MTPNPPLSPELREAERSIDRVYMTNALMREPFAEAAWSFMAYCEHILADPQVPRDLSAHIERREIADAVVNHVKNPIYWLWKIKNDGGRVPPKCREEIIRSAQELSNLSTSYTPFETVYTYASRGIFPISRNGTSIISGPEFKEGLPYEVYDQIASVWDDHSQIPKLPDSQKAVREVESRLRFYGNRISYKLDPKLVTVMFECVTDIPFGPAPQLPANWQFSRYSMGDFQRFAQVLRSLCLIHAFAGLHAARLGVWDVGNPDSLILMRKQELHNRFIRYTGLPDGIVNSLIEDLTYGASGIHHPDPALQPIIPLTSAIYAIPPHFILSSSMERNFAVLINRIPREKTAYSRLSSEREKLTRNRIIDELTKSRNRIRTWHGRVPGWGKGSEVDLFLAENSSKSCLFLELKSFIAPAEVQEVCNRSEEIKRGIEQIRLRQQLLNSRPDGAFEVLEIDETWEIDWAVASESFVGASYVQDDDVPVVRVSHLAYKIKTIGLRMTGEWLRHRLYLPVEGKHFYTREVQIQLDKWTLNWYFADVNNPKKLIGET